MYTIPNIPLKLPIKENLSKEPEYPYQWYTRGSILGRKFEDYLAIVSEYWNKPDRLKKEMLEHFESHVIYDILDLNNLNQLGDFARHVLRANYDEIGWDIVDLEMNRLDNILIPSWRLPNFDFVVHFDHILTRIVKVYFPDRLIDEIKRILESNEIEELQLEKNVKTYLHLWTVRELWLLLSYLGSAKEQQPTESRQQLINIICNQFEEIITTGGYPIHEKICLIILFIDGYAGLSKQAALLSKEYVDRVWLEIKELPYQEKLSYKYLMGAAYSLIGEQLFRQDTDFITRKLFVDSIVQNYIEAEEYNLQNWFADLLDKNVNELIMDLLIRGYSKTVPLLRKHVIELPNSKTKSDLVSTINYLNSILKLVGLIFLEPPVSMTDDEVRRMLNRFEERFQFSKVKRNLLDMLYAISLEDIFIESSNETIPVELYHQFVSSVFKQGLSNAHFRIYELNYVVNKDLYPYKLNYEKIKDEEADKHSLILSPTFELELIEKLSFLLQSFSEFPTNNDIFIMIYEVMSQYILNWLNQFYQEEKLFNEALMILSPLIHICLVQQIKYYYENNYPKKAFLANLNLHSFMEVYSDEQERLLATEFKSIKLSEKNVIESRFKQITKDWSVGDLLEPILIKEMIIDTQDFFKSSGLNSKGYSGSLVEDNIIHGYLDEVEQLEYFIGMNYQNESTSIVDTLIKSGFHTAFDGDSIYGMERIGSEEGAQLPIPLFNNLHKLAVATELFEIRAKVANVMERREEVIRRYERFQISTD